MKLLSLRMFVGRCVNIGKMARMNGSALFWWERNAYMRCLGVQGSNRVKLLCKILGEPTFDRFYKLFILNMETKILFLVYHKVSADVF